MTDFMTLNAFIRHQEFDEALKLAKKINSSKQPVPSSEENPFQVLINNLKKSEFFKEKSWFHSNQLRILSDNKKIDLLVSELLKNEYIQEIFHTLPNKEAKRFPSALLRYRKDDFYKEYFSGWSHIVSPDKTLRALFVMDFFSKIDFMREVDNNEELKQNLDKFINPNFNQRLLRFMYLTAVFAAHTLRNIISLYIHTTTRVFLLFAALAVISLALAAATLAGTAMLALLPFAAPAAAAATVASLLFSVAITLGVGAALTPFGLLQKPFVAIFLAVGVLLSAFERGYENTKNNEMCESVKENLDFAGRISKHSKAEEDRLQSTLSIFSRSERPANGKVEAEKEEEQNTADSSYPSPA